MYESIQEILKFYSFVHCFDVGRMFCGRANPEFVRTKIADKSSESVTITSYYVPASDGTRLALDVHIPAFHTPGTRYPVLLVLTRY